jgi:hypothetical protein
MENPAEKRPLTFSLFALRLISGIIGGVIGTLAVFIAYFAMLNFLPPTPEATSISSFIIIIMAFVGTLSANTSTALMVSFMDNGKYKRRKTIITQVFVFNLILFLFTIPIYFLGISMDMVNAVAALHFLLSAFISALIMEVLAGHEYSLVGIYGSALGMFFSVVLAFLAIKMNVKPMTIMFAAMPAVWVLLQVAGGITELIYDGFIGFYGVDALSTETDLGGDTETETDEEEDESDKS